ncbi:MAG: universal stress protein [Chloroflexi bacterium]|jgi:nucleotide-binding universal stress UspA family protein|nr:universal stress protein [Chloroflexota bacterium]
MFGKILVPVDSSEESRTILRWAVGLAKATKSDLTLLTVIDTEDFQIVKAAATGQTDTTAPGGIISKISEKVKADLESEAASLQATGIGIDVKVVAGSPAEAIVAEAEAVGADVIAMSTRRESALARGILGSVTDRVLHSTSIPLMILQPEDISDEGVGSGFIQHIVVPLDGSTLSEDAVAPATALAQATGAELVFTEVIKPPVYGMDMGGVGYGAAVYAEDMDTKLLEESSAKYLEQFVENAETAGLKAHAKVRVGNPSIQIVNEASETEGSVIVMATHGAGGLKRWVVGSVTDKTVRAAHRPVLVIPPSAD